MIIALTLLPDRRAQVKPAMFLDGMFNKYRAACEASGAMFDRELKSNTAPLERVPAVIEALRAEGFDPRVHPDLSLALTAAAGAVRTQEAAASVRAASVNARMAAKGLGLFPFQAIGVNWISPRTCALLADDPGLGKTIQMLTAAEEGRPIVVIAPAVAKGVWLREALRWRPDLQPMILSGRNSFRVPLPGEMVILNPDILPAIEAEDDDGELVKLKPFEDLLPGTIVIVDECHAFKSHKSQRTQRLRKLNKAAWKAGGKVWAATGTPLMNRPEELASLLTTFGLFQECFGSWTRYLRVMNGNKAQWGGYNWGAPTPAAIEGIKRVMLRRRREEVLPDLPTKLYEIVDVELDAKTQKECDAARALLESIGVSLEDAINKTKSLGSAFAELSRLRKALATAKLPHLLEMLPEYEDAGEPVVVFSAHRAPIDALAGRPGWATITGDTPPAERTKLEDLFQTGVLKGLAGTIEAMGVSITLTRANQAIFIDVEWTPSLNLQAEDRICRIGQTRGVIIKTLIAPNTIDADVQYLLRTKKEIIANTIDAAAVKGDHRANQDLLDMW